VAWKHTASRAAAISAMPAPPSAALGSSFTASSRHSWYFFRALPRTVDVSSLPLPWVGAGGFLSGVGGLGCTLGF
jgi:hypothetical protein